MIRTGGIVYAREFAAADDLTAVDEAKVLASRSMAAGGRNSERIGFEAQRLHGDGRLSYRMSVSR